MKRWPRRLVKWTGAIASVLLVVVWIGSAWWTGYVIRTHPEVAWGFAISSGRLHLVLRDDTGLFSSDAPGWWTATDPADTPGLASLYWWFDGIYFRDDGTEHANFATPLWFLALLVGAPPAWMIRTDWKRRRMLRAGRCANCNYDLRGDLKSGCPECGWGRTGDDAASA